jgi:crotonobetainyl-CoA:carnitine CoA-transferase CaiB-like acyl-CoA transferase
VCTLYLADLGADVIKVEDTGAGDYARALDAPPGETSAFYRAVNRNKRSIAMDLKDPRGREAFVALVRDADIVVESFRPGVMRGLGVDAHTLLAVNPRLVFASISGYGQDGPRAAMAGHDINYLGYAGVLDQTGAAGGPPALCNLQIADLLGGAATAAIAILGAVIGAMRTGCGRVVDVAMADASLAHNIFALHALSQRGSTVPRGEDLLTGGVPCYGVYPTRDGRWLAVGALEPKFWRLLCETLDRVDLVPLGLSRDAEGARARDELARIFAGAPLSHWTERFANIDCCVTPILTLQEALDDPQFRARGMAIGKAGTRQFAPPFRLDGTRFEGARPAPGHGEHTREVLRRAGIGDADIDALARDRVVLVP